MPNIDAMVGWPTRWDSSVGRDQHPQHGHHPHPFSSPGITVTEQEPNAPFVNTCNHNHNNHFDLNHHNQPLSSSTSSSKVNHKCLNREPLSVISGSLNTLPQNHHDNNSLLEQCPPAPPDPVLSNHNGYPLSVVTSSCSPTGVPSSSSSSVHNKPLERENSLFQSPPNSSSSFETKSYPSSNSCERETTQNHSLPCHTSSSPSVVPVPTNLNGNSQLPVTHPHILHLDDTCSWLEVTETAPLTNNNGEVGRFRVNGVATVMQSKEETMAEGEEEEEEQESGEELICGLGKWCSPPCSQRLANKQMFFVVFCFTSILQGMFYTYFVSVLTTIEKLFQLKSKTTGIIMSATEMGQIGGALLLTYYGGHGHRPKWIGWGIVLFAFCALLCSLPHFLFGPELLQRYLEVTPSDDNPLDSPNICKKTLSSSSIIREGSSEVLLEGETSDNDTLLGSELAADSLYCESQDSYGILAIFFISLLGVGIGQTAAYNLGIPYIDDNIASKDTPLYFAGTSGVRILGPTLGFVLGSVCTRLYVYPMTDPGIDTSDPRWIGAWWLGLVFVAIALFLTSIAMFAFPRRLPRSPKSVRHAFQSPKRNPSLRDFPKAVQRLLKNEILMLRTASSVLHILPIAGLYTFLPKYLESQFRLPVHNAALVSGLGGILIMGIGIVASGLFIRKAKPSPKGVAGWIAMTALVYSIGMIILMFVGCAPDDLVGLMEDESNGKYFSPQCERTCGTCDDTMYAPVCDSQQKMHFSACHLGCSNATQISGSKKLLFSKCDCVDENVTAELRLCDLKCDNFIWYVVIFSIFVLIHSTSEVGGMLVTLRCVEPKDKAMALGLISVAIGLFGNVPCPIIYGAVVDSACIQWKERCNELGACQLYDSDIFRMFFHGITGAVMMLAFIVDVIVWHKAKSVSFHEHEEGEEETSPMNPKSLSQSPSTPIITEQTPTTSTAPEVSTVCSTSEGEGLVQSEDDQSESCV